MKCPACSTQVAVDASWCITCGYPLKAAQHPAHTPHPGSNPYTGQTFASTGLIVGGVILAIAMDNNTLAHLMIAAGFCWFIGVRIATR